MSTHPKLVWPRTDGNKSEWPPCNTPQAGGKWFEAVPESHNKYDVYAKAAGAHLAGILGLPALPGGQSHKIPLPSGYRIFVHKQPKTDGTVREDYYCYGSTTTSKLRSAQEYKDHAAWLFNTSNSLDMHNKMCTCNRSKTGIKAESSAASASTPVKRAAKTLTPGSLPKAKKPRISSSATAASEEEEDVGPTGIAPERGHDLSSGRRFRRGELVWVKIKPIAPPTSDLPVITHWPVLIADSRLKQIVTPPVAAMPSKLSSAEASSSTAATARQTVSQYWEYHLRPLGMFSRSDDIIGDIKDLLPWVLGDELLGGRSGWQALAREGTRVLLEGIKKEAEVQKETKAETPIRERWETNWAQRIKFGEMGEGWDVAVIRIGVAIKTGISIAKSWCYTDRIDVIAETALSEADRKAVAAGSKTFWQGLWLGGERLWVEDIVRFRKSRSELPSDLGDGGSDADNRAVFIRIRAISMDIGPSSTDPTKDEWKCTVHGDIAELVASGFAHPVTWAVDETSTPLVRDYKAPKGWGFKQLNDTGSEVACDIADIAGRVYPDLLDPSTQTWFSLPGGPTPDGRHLPGKIAQAVIGLQPGSVACASSVVWSEDLFMIVDTSQKEAEKSVRDYYGRELEHLAGKIPGEHRLYKKKSVSGADSDPAQAKSTATAPASASLNGAATAPAPATLNDAIAKHTNTSAPAPAPATMPTPSSVTVTPASVTAPSSAAAPVAAATNTSNTAPISTTNAPNSASIPAPLIPAAKPPPPPPRQQFQEVTFTAL